MRVFYIDGDKLEFPDPTNALSEPNGLLAMGGDLSPARLLLAYQNGIFPWFNEGEPVLWWSPNPRSVLFPSDFRVNRNLRRVINKNQFEFKINTAFEEVINYCAAPRKDEPDTWINKAMIDAYSKLYQLGNASSFECWQDNKLVGGLYGVSLGKIFCAESMFRLVDNASKLAVYFLCQTMLENLGVMIDIQIMSPHLKTWGAKEISREKYLQVLENNH